MKRTLLLALLVLTGCADLVTDTFTFASVEVRAVRRNGEPVARTAVTLFTGQRVMGRDSTGADGVHRFNFVPSGIYGVFATPPEGYERPEVLLGGPSSASQSGFTIGEGDKVEVEFTYLKVGPGGIEGVATEPDGSPVEGVAMGLFSPFDLVGRDTTGANGTVSFTDLPFGVYGIFADPPPVYREGENAPSPVQDGLVVEEGFTDRAIFELERCEGVVTIRVLDQEDEPVRDKLVEVFRPQGVVGDGPTGPNGEITFRHLLCRGHGIRLLPQPGFFFDEGRGTGFVDGIKITRGFEETFVFRVERCFGVIEVRVQDDTGAPVPAAAVDLYTGEGVLRRLGSSADGRATFEEVPCGPPYGVRVAAPDGYSVDEGRGSSFFDDISVDSDDPVELLFTLTALSPSR